MVDLFDSEWDNSLGFAYYLTSCLNNSNAQRDERPCSKFVAALRQSDDPKALKLPRNQSTRVFQREDRSDFLEISVCGAVLLVSKLHL